MFEFVCLHKAHGRKAAVEPLLLPGGPILLPIMIRAKQIALLFVPPKQIGDVWLERKKDHIRRFVEKSGLELVRNPSAFAVESLFENFRRYPSMSLQDQIGPATAFVADPEVKRALMFQIDEVGYPATRYSALILQWKKRIHDITIALKEQTQRAALLIVLDVLHARLIIRSMLHIPRDFP